MKQQRRLLIIGLFLFVQMGVVRLLALFPDFIENYYSNGLYPLISKGFRYVFGWLPFSFGDIMYTVLIFIALREIVLLFRSRFKTLKIFAIRTLALASLVYGAFHLLWGMNYYRLPLHESLSIDNEYTTEELVALTEKLITKSNALYDRLATNDTMAVEMPLSRSEIFSQTIVGYKALNEQFPKLDYPPKSIKTSLLSYPLSVMGYSGYLNPITNEAQINGLVPDYRHPVISCHEQAHQLGYAKENEANFIGVLSTLNNDNLHFQYSGSIFALRYCINDVFRRDSELGKELREKIRPGILKNYAVSREFWDSMENPLEPVFKLFYSSYLKANNQPAGIKSYSYMVALLVNYNKSFPSSI